MLRVSGLTLDRFEPLYWAGRAAYDDGSVTGIGFWQEFARKGGLDLDQATIEELNRWDARFWTVENLPMVAWQLALKQHGLRTAILSNMGDSVLESVERAFDWIQRFDVRVWSYQLRLIKPDPAIYRYTLGQLGLQAEETLFIDDRMENVEAARALGMQAIEYLSVERLREDLIAAGQDKVLPLPE
jgi:putative hydrolase of the HAD superfamily